MFLAGATGTLLNFLNSMILSDNMANLTVRKLDRNVYEKLRLRAAKHGISIEEEARRILSQAVSGSEKFSDVFKKYFGIENGVHLDLLNQPGPHDPSR
jgi:plasmid stability protein